MLYLPQSSRSKHSAWVSNLERKGSTEMTMEEALKEAQGFLGGTAVVGETRGTRYGVTYEIGVGENRIFQLLGTGVSWEEAIRDARITVEDRRGVRSAG